jgi:hypothetical protein
MGVWCHFILKQTSEEVTSFRLSRSMSISVQFLQGLFPLTIFDYKVYILY